MNSTSINLKISSNTLADASRHLRREANKFRNKFHKAKDRNLGTQDEYLEAFQDLSNLRMDYTKKCARAVYLARAFINDVPYKHVESKRNDDKYFYDYVLYEVVNQLNGHSEDYFYSYDDVKKWADAGNHKSFWSNFKFW